MPHALQFIFSVILTAAAMVGGVMVLNGWVDPFMQYRLPAYEPRFSAGFARHINAGLARHLDYDSIIVGSSYTMNFRNSDFDREFGGRTASFAIPGMYASEGRQIVDFALSNRHVRRVFYGIDFAADLFAFDTARSSYLFPSYLYDNSLLNDYPYLASLDTMKRSLNIISGRSLRNYNSSYDAPWAWANERSQFSRKKAIDHYAQLSRERGHKPPSFEAMTRAAESAISHYGSAYPDTDFHFFLPPYAALTWMLHEQRGNLEQLMEFRVALARMIGRNSNMRLHDFQAMEKLICDLDHYSDSGHYGPLDNHMLVGEMRRGEHVASPTTITINNSIIRKIVSGRCGESIARPQN